MGNVHSITARKIPHSDDFQIVMSVGYDDDQIDVIFTFNSLHDDENPSYDLDIQVLNMDWAGLDDMHKALGLAIAAFKRLGFDKSCFELGLESYRVTGM